VPTLCLAYAIAPQTRAGRNPSSAPPLSVNPVADRNVTYVADTRAIYDHKVHLVREDLGTDGTDADRLKPTRRGDQRGPRSHAASVRYRGDPRATACRRR
jgi:hypothetical protein